jgi:hypothetical protein
MYYLIAVKSYLLVLFLYLIDLLQLKILIRRNDEMQWVYRANFKGICLQPLYFFNC